MSSVAWGLIRWATKFSAGSMRLSLSRDCVAVDPAHPTGTVSVELDGGGQPTYVIHENVAWDFLQPGPAMLGLAGAADAVCFGSLAPAIGRFAGRDPRVPPPPGRIVSASSTSICGSTTSTRRRLPASLSCATVLKLNDEELPVVAKLLSIGGTEEEMLDALCRRFDLRLIALTKGGQRFAAIYAQ